MPNRVIREGLLDSDRVGLVSVEAEMLFVRLMLLADDYGRYDGRPVVICRRAFVNRRQVVDEECALWLSELVTARLVVLYEVAGKPFLVVPDFNQRLRAKRSKYPPPPFEENQEDNSLPDRHVTDTGPAHVGHARTESESESEAEEKKCASNEAPQCPHDAIVAEYHRVLPAAQRVKVWNDERQALLRSRWREDPARQSVAWWSQFFDTVGRSDFLMGRVQSQDRSPFVLTLEWLVRPRNFANVLEGKYANRERAANRKILYATATH